MAATICELLREQGYQTESVVSGADAIAKVAQLSPALVILDVGLPDQDGVEVALELVSDRRTAHLPVLFVSGRDDLAARVRECRQLNCDFLRKPYGETDLLARVERCLAESDLRARLESDARIDELTGLGNPRLLDERLGVEAARRARYGTPLTILVMDLDGLKQVNDKHGHMTGTAVLREVGEAVRREIRETDVAFRYGGDEFVVLLPHTEIDRRPGLLRSPLAAHPHAAPGGAHRLGQHRRGRLRRRHRRLDPGAAGPRRQRDLCRQATRW